MPKRSKFDFTRAYCLKLTPFDFRVAALSPTVHLAPTTPCLPRLRWPPRSFCGTSCTDTQLAVIACVRSNPPATFAVASWRFAALNSCGRSCALVTESRLPSSATTARFEWRLRGRRCALFY